jgi:hypothetical protein
MTVRHVSQEDPCGCVVAALAMVTGRSYEEVKAYFIGCDFQTEGISHDDAMTYLGDTGYATQRRYWPLPYWVPDAKTFEWEMQREGGLVQARRKPWPCAPWAPAHLMGINGGRHCVVLLRDGTVLDPNQDAPRRIEDVGHVSYILGVFQVSEIEAVERMRQHVARVKLENAS